MFGSLLLINYKLISEKTRGALPRVHFNVYAGSFPLGRIVMELRSDVAPKTAETSVHYVHPKKDSAIKGA